jgi:hypothetical protein
MREADELLEEVTHAQLTMALPKGINTLETAHGNWTRPDNVFMSHEILDLVVICNIAPEYRPVHADHLPIRIRLDVGVEKTSAMESYLWKEVEWKEFKEDLEAALRAHGPPQVLNSIAELEHAAILMDSIMEELTAKHVRKIRMSGHTKRWWTSELGEARAKFRSLKLKAWKLRHEPEHPIHAETRTSSTAYKELIKTTKNLCWKKFIENARDFSIWLVHKTVTGTGSDGGRARLPALRATPDDDAEFVTENHAKARVLHTEFFPPPPLALNPAEALPPLIQYPEDVEPFAEITDEQIRRAIKRMESWKAIMKGDIPNHAVKHCADVLVPYLGEMYRATFRLNHYLLRPELSDYGPELAEL